jgi:peptidyl-prolyl cis-trans isomerase B (cyclophilin B)
MGVNIIMRNLINRCRMLAVLLILILAGNMVAACRSTIDLHGYVRTEETSRYVAIITEKDDEAIIIELNPDMAPITVENFQKLVGEHFYDGLTFHRVVDGYLIQGGDPSGDGSGGPGYTITGEFSLNGISNTLNHIRGTVSMARSDDYNSAGSQFFICQDEISSLDRKYAAFGMVVEGMAVVDRIAAVPNSGSPNNNPVKKQVMKEVFFVTPASDNQS